MKTKHEVYVVVDTPKKAKKLSKVLEMFGEEVFTEPNHNNSDHNGENKNWYYGFSRGQWQGLNTKHYTFKEFPSEVTIKELRNILAVEHLKKGDVVVVYNKHGKWIIKLTGNDIERFEHSSSYDLDLSLLNDKGSIEKINKIYGGSFIRYATEEEKALLNPHEEPKPELEVGKWYIIDHDGYYSPTAVDAIVFNTGDYYGYGFSHEGCWTEKYALGNYNIHKFIKREATHQEVEQALIKEAKKRGYVEGAIINCLEFEKEYTLTSRKHWNDFDGKELLMVESRGTGVWIFKDGKWAEVVKEAPKFEVEIDAKPLHDAIQRYKKELRKVNSKLYYRIKPSGRVIFNRSMINLTRCAGDWKEYTGQDINELI